MSLDPITNTAPRYHWEAPNWLAGFALVCFVAVLALWADFLSSFIGW